MRNTYNDGPDPDEEAVSLMRFQLGLIVVPLMLMALTLLAPSVQAQSSCVQPVFSENPIDGRLVGFEADCRFGNWEPFGSAGYGLKSKSFRYKVGLGLLSSALPLVGDTGGLRASLVNWPSSPILGQLGESGVALALNRGSDQARIFWGRFWSEVGRGPQVAYLTIDGGQSYSLPYAIFLTSSSNMTFGLLRGTGSELGRTFNASSQTVTLGIGDLRLTGRWGHLTNEADLKDFEFVAGVRGIAKALRGHDFWSLDVERRFTLYQMPIPLPLDLPMIGNALPFQVSGALTFQAGSATHQRPPFTPVAQMEGAKHGEETETLFSWGLAAIVSLSQFQLRADFVFTQDGQFQFLMNF